MESVSCSESEQWEQMFAIHVGVLKLIYKPKLMTYFQNKKFFTEAHNSYRSICANYLTFQNFVSNADLEASAFLIKRKD